MSMKRVSGDLDLDCEPSEDEVEFAVRYAAQKAQESVNNYSVEQISEFLNKHAEAKRAAIETGFPAVTAIRRNNSREKQ